MSKNKPVEILKNEVYTIDYPFYRDARIDENGKLALTWIPGTKCIECEKTRLADGVGRMMNVVVSIHRPGSFPTRVFYVRVWVAPDSHMFGKNNLSVMEIGHFRRMLKGYRLPYNLVTR